MGKRISAVFFALLVALSLVPIGPIQAAAAKELFFIAVNDSAPELTGDSAPIWIGNTVYVPCSLFDRRVTGVSLGISYSWSSDAILLFSGERTLEFDISAGKAYADGGSRAYDYQAVIRNGRPYVPAVNACRFFGIQTTMLYTTSGPLLRIKDGNQELSDKLFMDSVEPLFATRLAQYNSANSGQVGNPGGKPGTVPTTPEPSDPVSGQEKVVYTAVRVTGGLELEGSITALNGRGVKGLFFFSTEELSGYDKALRRLAGSGHGVGLILQGQTLQEQLENLGEGNRLLYHILRQETVFVLSTGQSAEVEAGLRDAGYLLWRANVREEGQGASALIEQIKKQHGRARVLFQANNGSGSLTALLRGMQVEPFDLRQPRETSY
jgi:hypothetical protein